MFVGSEIAKLQHELFGVRVPCNIVVDPTAGQNLFRSFYGVGDGIIVGW